jgi:hypothetical protein
MYACTRRITGAVQHSLGYTPKWIRMSKSKEITAELVAMHFNPTAMAMRDSAALDGIFALLQPGSTVFELKFSALSLQPMSITIPQRILRLRPRE